MTLQEKLNRIDELVQSVEKTHGERTLENTPAYNEAYKSITLTQEEVLNIVNNDIPYNHVLLIAEKQGDIIAGRFIYEAADAKDRLAVIEDIDCENIVIFHKAHKELGFFGHIKVIPEGLLQDQKRLFDLWKTYEIEGSRLKLIPQPKDNIIEA